MKFSGGIVTATGIEEKAGMKGSRVLEVGSESLIPGFEDQLVGMRAGETKTFRIEFPKEYGDAEIQGKEAEFTVTVQEVKEKKLPELNDEFSKQMGYEGLEDLRKKINEHLTREKTQESEEKLKGDLVQALITKHEFEVPQSLIEGQTRALAQEWAEQLKQQSIDEKTIQAAILREVDELRKRAERQVRASLILEAVAKKEEISVSDAEVEGEISNTALAMRVEAEKLREFYAKNPGRKEDLLFRLRQDKTLKFLVDKAKVKSS
jgi:trigger factor